MPYVRIAPGANPDPHAVALARDVHVAVQPDVVISMGPGNGATTGQIRTSTCW